MDISEAFHATVTDATTVTNGAYLVLRRREQFYGGPEEGGWYGWDDFVVAYKHFPSEDLARAAMGAVEAYAKDLNREATDAQNRAARAACELADARGEDLGNADDAYWTLPDEHYVRVETGIPQDERESRHWE
jgi:hypothetical protein